MAGFMETVKIKVTALVKDAVGDFRELTVAIKQAETATDKMHVAGGRLKGAITGLGTAALVKGGVEIAKAAAKGAVEMDKFALSINGFAKRTGMSLDMASRWVETAGDMGISSEKLEKSFQRTSIAIAQNSADFEKYGIEIAKTADGNVDISRTYMNMVNAIKAIEDPAMKSTAAVDLLGKMGAEALTKMGTSSKVLADELARVDEAQIVKKEDIERAAETKKAVDEMKDSWEGLKISLARLITDDLAALVSTLATVAGWLVKGTEAVNGMKDKIAEFIPFVDKLGESKTVLGGVINRVTGLFEDEDTAVQDLEAAQVEATAAAQEQAEAHKELDDAVSAATDAILGAFDAEQKYFDSLERVNKTIADNDSSARDQADAIRKAAEASVENAVAQANQAGVTIDATQQQKLMIDELNRLAQKAAPAAQQQIAALVAELAKVQSKAVTMTVNTVYKTTGTPPPGSTVPGKPKAGPAVVNVTVRGYPSSRVALGRDITRAVRAADRWRR